MTSKSRYEFIYNQSKHFVRICFFGLVDYDLILASYNQVVESSNYLPGMGRIWDVSEADPSGLTNTDIWMASNYSKMFRSGVNDVKVALLSENE